MNEHASENKLVSFLKNIIGANIVWFIFNLPLVILAVILMRQAGPLVLSGLVLLMIVLVPFVLFPATTALFGVVRNYILKEPVPLLKSYLADYKAHYIRSVEGGFLFTVAWGITGYIYLSNSDLNYFLTLLLGLIALILVVLTLNFFAMTVHLESSFSRALSNVLLVSIGGNFLSLAVGLLAVGIIYVSYTYALYLFPLVTGSAVAYLAFFAFLKLLQGIQALYDRQKKTLNRTEASDEANETSEK